MVEEAKKALLPAEYFLSVSSPTYAKEDVDEYWSEYESLKGTQDASIHTIDPQSYTISIETALFLYRNSPEKSRDVVLNAIGWGTDANHFISLAAAARDAFNVQDYYLLGGLAFRFEQSLAEIEAMEKFRWSETLVETQLIDQDEERTGVLGLFDRAMKVSEEKVISRIDAAFKNSLVSSKHFIQSTQLSQAACGYFNAVPSYLVLPDIGSKSPQENAQGWGILRSLLNEPIELLKCSTEIPHAWNEISHPALRDWLCKSAEPIEADWEKMNLRVRRIRNPFVKAAGRCGLEPRKQRVTKSAKKSENTPSKNESIANVWEASDSTEKDDAKDSQSRSSGKSRGFFWNRKKK